MSRPSTYIRPISFPLYLSLPERDTSMPGILLITSERDTSMPGILLITSPMVRSPLSLKLST